MFAYCGLAWLPAFIQLHGQSISQNREGEWGRNKEQEMMGETQEKQDIFEK